MILIFCNNEDHVANSLFLHLKEKKTKVRLVNAEELVFARSWTHQCGENGVFMTKIILPDGYTISSENISCIFNRIRFFPTTHFLKKEDFEYAQMEFHALYVSFLLSVNEKLFEKIHTHHLSSPGYDTYCMKMAIEAGISVLDQNFIASPRSLPKVTGNSFVAQPEQFGVKYKKWAYAVTPDAPRVIREKTVGSSCTAIVAGDQLLVPKEISRLKKKISLYAKKISRSFFELHFGETAEGYKLITTEIFPKWVSEEVIGLIAAQVINKK